MKKEYTLLERAIIAEYESRRLHKIGERVSYRADFPKQNKYLNDRWEHRYRTALCTRRAGKSVGECIDSIEIGEQFPNSRLVYGSITVDSTWSIIYDPIMELDEKFKIGIRPKVGDRVFELKNGSTIKIFGLDASYRQIRKILGHKLRKATIDEAGSITMDLEKMVKQSIKPALADLRPYSWLSLIGTPENIPNTYYQKVTDGKDKDLDWSNHRWTGHDNPFIFKQWKEEIDEMTTANPLVINASWFKTHYLGEWCTDEELKIISLSDHNYVDELPTIEGVHWRYVLGSDLGYNDACAFVVFAYSPYHQNCYIVEAIKDTRMDFTAYAEQVRMIQRKYNIQTIIVDGANKQGIMEVQNRHKIPLINAEKVDKATHLHLLNDDVKQSKVKLLNGKCGELITEWNSLIWESDNRDTEDGRCSNHLSDASLYAWRFCLHYVNRKIEKKKSIHTSEGMKQWEKRFFKKKEEEFKRKEKYGY